jgi:hypothetical protein
MTGAHARRLLLYARVPEFGLIAAEGKHLPKLEPLEPIRYGGA